MVFAADEMSICSHHSAEQCEETVSIQNRRCSTTEYEYVFDCKWVVNDCVFCHMILIKFVYHFI